MKLISDLILPHIIIPALPPQYLQRPRHALRSHFDRAPYAGARLDRAGCARDERDGSLVHSTEVGDYCAGGVVDGGGAAGGGGLAGEVHAGGDGTLAVGAQLGLGGADAGGVGGGEVVGGGTGGAF